MASLRSLLGLGARKSAAADAQRDRALDEGIALYESGDAAAAADRFERVLAEAPGHPRALNLAGVARLALGETAFAEVLIRRAIDADPAPHIYWFNLGTALLARASLTDAARAFENAIRRAPDHFASLFNLGRVRMDLGQYDAAIECGRRFAALRPDDPSALTELGSMHYRKAGTSLLTADFDASIDLFRRALAHPEIPPPARHNARLFLGDALTRRGRHTEALAFFRALHAEAPDDLDANVHLGNCLNSLGRIRDAAPYYEKVLRLNPRHLPAVSSAISAADYDHRIDALENTRRRFEKMRLFADPARHRTWPNERDPERRLRIGYVSPDFRDHVAMALFEDVLARHDRSRFEIFAYDCAAYRDDRNRRLRGLADHWREIDNLDVSAATAQIRADAIDLLIDLAGHTAGNRLMVFARKPAPVQATWLAYPGSTGLPEIDYIVSDALTSPSGSEALCSESVWRLASTRFCYTPPSDSPEPRLPDPSRPLTLGCFNNPSKLNPAVLALWRAILDRVPEARLLFKYATLDDPSGRDWLAADLITAGIDIARVEMRGHSAYAATLAQYADVHLALDPFPFCGGLTSLDALWMGVPVVTLAQTLMAGRQTQAFLGIMRHPELVAADEDAYIRLAVDLVRDRDRLAEYRSRLRPALRASPLFDYSGFTRELEAAWRGMWRAWCLAEPQSS